MGTGNDDRAGTGPAEENQNAEKRPGAGSGEPPCSHSTPGAGEGTGQEGKEKRSVGADDRGSSRTPGAVRKPVQSVERVTALRGQAIAKTTATLKKNRRTTQHELLANADIPYAELEKVLSRVFCAMVERQDRASEALLLRINDLQYRMDDAECALRERKGTGRSTV
jgi:hypothetical protein